MNPAQPMRKVAVVVSSPMTVRAFLPDVLRALGERYALTLVVNEPQAAQLLEELGVRGQAVHLPIERPIRPWADWKALWQLQRLLRRERFDLVHSITPKAGLLAVLAGTLAGVPQRVHTFTGQVWATRHGPGRWLLRGFDRLVARLATQVLVDGPLQREFLIAQGVVRAERATVLAYGKLCGVDTTRFAPDPAGRERLRQRHGLAPDAVVFVFLGRLTRDKGVFDLLDAFERLCREAPALDAHLWLIGPDEDGLWGEIQVRQAAGGDLAALRARLHHEAYTPHPEHLIQAADVCCLPSYREGFNNVILECAAVGIPAIGSRIYGVADTMEEQVTGLLFEVRDVAGLCAAMRQLAESPDQRRRMGAAARQRVLDRYTQEVLTAAWLAFYARMLGGSHGEPHHHGEHHDPMA